eukprot:scaffold2206_cov316-Pavlova_lutheri.AAC.8
MLRNRWLGCNRCTTVKQLCSPRPRRSTASPSLHRHTHLLLPTRNRRSIPSPKAHSWDRLSPLPSQPGGCPPAQGGPILCGMRSSPGAWERAIGDVEARRGARAEEEGGRGDGGKGVGRKMKPVRAGGRGGRKGAMWTPGAVGKGKREVPTIGDASIPERVAPPPNPANKGGCMGGRCAARQWKGNVVCGRSRRDRCIQHARRPMNARRDRCAWCPRTRAPTTHGQLPCERAARSIA